MVLKNTKKHAVIVMAFIVALIFCFASVSNANAFSGLNSSVNDPNPNVKVTKKTVNISVREGTKYSQTTTYDRSVNMTEKNTSKQNRAAAKTTAIKKVSKKINGKKYDFVINKAMNAYYIKESESIKDFEHSYVLKKNYDAVVGGTVKVTSPSIKGYKLDSVKTTTKNSGKDSSQRKTYNDKIINHTYQNEKYSVQSPSITVKTSKKNVVVTYSFQQMTDVVQDARNKTDGTKRTLKEVNSYTQVLTYKKK